MDAERHNAGQYEEEHVHAVYEQIATHFSQTRYKVRPFSTVEVLIYILPKPPRTANFLPQIHPHTPPNSQSIKEPVKLIPPRHV